MICSRCRRDVLGGDEHDCPKRFRKTYQQWLESYAAMEATHGRKVQAEAIWAAMKYADEMCSEK